MFSEEFDEDLVLEDFEDDFEEDDFDSYLTLDDDLDDDFPSDLDDDFPSDLDDDFPSDLDDDDLDEDLVDAMMPSLLSRSSISLRNDSV